jgi:polar amino acid transport system substrate-binding protein
MADVAARGALRVGVDENTLLLSFRNPRSGELEGFEIDLLREIAAAIFGDRDPSRLQFDTVTTAQKIAVVTAGEVDLTASAVTMTCGRWRDVSFSTPYYLALQKVLVRADAQGVAVFPDGTSVPDVTDVGALDTALAGRKVCWTTGSTSIDNIRQFLPHAKVTQVDTRTDCLMALQEGEIDAVSTHDTFLLGYQQQDPNTAILAPSFSVQPYGIAVAKDRQDLVRFLNALISQLRDNGVLEQIYRKNFLDCTACVGLDVPPSLLVASVEPQWRD